MNHITVLEENIKRENQRRWYLFLSLEKFLIEKNFDWLKIFINEKNKSLIGKGELKIGGKSYNILISYSPFINIDMIEFTLMTHQ